MKIAPQYKSPTVHVLDASKSVVVVSTANIQWNKQSYIYYLSKIQFNNINKKFPLFNPSLVDLCKP